MKEGSILVVLEGVVDFLIPYHASICGRDIDQLDPERIPDQVIGENGSTLQTSIGPSIAVRVSNVETSNCDGLDLVGSLWNRPLDSLLVSVGEDRGHVDRWRKREETEMEDWQPLPSDQVDCS